MATTKRERERERERETDSIALLKVYLKEENK